MISNASIELSNQESRTPAYQSLRVENPYSLSEGQRVQVRWMSSQLVHSAVTTTATGESGEGFSFTRSECKKQAALCSADGTITKELPDSPPNRSDANTIHFTPDPVFDTTEYGELYKRTQPPLVIPHDSYADFTVTALR